MAFWALHLVVALLWTSLANGQPDVVVAGTTTTTVSVRIQNPGYSVTYGDNTQEFSSDGSRLIIVENLIPSTTYNFEIGEKTDGAATSITATTDLQTVPNPPQDVKVSRITPTSVTLLVVPPADDGGAPVTHYEVKYDGVTLSYKTDESLIIENMRPSTQYSMSVSAKNSIGVGQPVTIVVTTDSVQVPSPVKITSDPHANSSNTYDIKWEIPENGGLPIREYHIKYRQVEVKFGLQVHMFAQPLGDWILSIVPADQFTYTTTNLAGGLHYQLEVSARNDLGWSLPSAMFIFITEMSDDQPRVVVAETGKTTVSMKVLTSGVEEGVQVLGYHVTFESISQEFSVESGPLIVVENLTPDTLYSFQIQVRTPNGFGPPTVVATRTKAPSAPGPPREVAYYRSTPTTVTLRVEPPEDTGDAQLIGYVVEDSGRTYFYDVADEIVVENLRPSTKYVLLVMAANDIGLSPSVKAGFTTLSVRRPYHVKHISSQQTESPSVYEIEWETPENGGLPITEYKVEYRQVEVRHGHIDRAVSDWIVANIPSHYHTYTMSHLAGNSHYQVVVASRNDMGWSKSSEEYHFSTA